jgi:hypothetical protein
MESMLNSTQFNPQYLGAVLINGVYYDKKTAKFLLFDDKLNINKNEEESQTFYEKFLNLFKTKN